MKIYLDHLARYVADKIRRLSPAARADAAKARAFRAVQVPRSPKRGPVATTFPNDLGGYPGKTIPSPRGRTPSPRELFFSLAAAYLLRARPRVAQKEGSSPPARRWVCLDPFVANGRFVKMYAATKSEFRALLKERFGLKTTRGMRVARA